MVHTRWHSAGLPQVGCWAEPAYVTVMVANTWVRHSRERDRTVSNMAQAETLIPVAEDPRRKLKTSSLYWFISSRHYVPMAEIRRRFQIEQTDGTLLDEEGGAIHIGLPEPVARALLDLVRKGKVGLEFAPEFNLRIAIGTFPMRVRPQDPRGTDRTF